MTLNSAGTALGGVDSFQWLLALNPEITGLTETVFYGLSHMVCCGWVLVVRAARAWYAETGGVGWERVVPWSVLEHGLSEGG